MKILMISPQPFFSPRGTPFSVYYRTLMLAEAGAEIDLLTYGQGQDVAIEGVRIIRIPRFAMLGPVKVGPSGLKLFLDIFMVIWTFGLLIRNHYDVVHAHEEAVFFSRFLKPIFGFKLIYDMHSSLPQQLSNFKFTRSSFLIRLFRLLEDACLQAADAVITICPDLADYATRVMKQPQKHILIENSLFEPVRIVGSCNPGVADAQKPVTLPKNKRCLVYAGTLEPYQGIDLLLQAFTNVLDQVPDAFLVIVGGTPQQVDQYCRLAQELNIQDHVLFTGQVPQAVARQYTQQASVLVSPRTRGTNTPLKIYEQLASGIPLVATRIYSHTQVLTDTVCMLVDPDPDAMARAIVQVLTSTELGKRLAQNARQYYDDYYSKPVYVRKIQTLLKMVS